VAWNNDPKALRAAIERALGPIGEDEELHFRPMFGGIMSYTRGRPFASLSNAGLALKLSPEDRETLLVEEDALPLRYSPEDSASKSYTLVPESWHDDPDKLLPILMKSIGYCSALPLKKKPRK